MLDSRQAQGVAASGPLVVDLDGAATAADTRVESMLLPAQQSPPDLFRLPLWPAQGREVMKSDIARRVTVAPEQLPYRQIRSATAANKPREARWCWSPSFPTSSTSRRSCNDT